MKKLLGLVAVVAVIAIAYSTQKGSNTEASVKDVMVASSSSINSADYVMADGAEDITQDYMCDEHTRFTANLTMENEVTISRDGVNIATLAAVASDSGKKFANADWEYFFKGENVLVTDKATGKAITCSPATDGDMAPVNVGE
jgi:membrane-bound inhibitor of C-type lysozyme